MEDNNLKEIVGKCIIEIEDVLPKIGMTHAVVVFYNFENGAYDMMGSFTSGTGDWDIIRAMEILETAALETKEAAMRKIQ